MKPSYWPLGDFNFDFALPLSGYQQKAKNFLHITRAFNLLQIIVNVRESPSIPGL